jgi:hypothetical protein
MSHTLAPIENNASARLPCRGCQPGCPSYEICDGKPWRLEASSSNTSSISAELHPDMPTRHV